MIIFSIFMPAVVLIAGLLIGYHLLLIVMAARYKPVSSFHSAKRRFMIIVPALNKEAVIGKTIYSLMGMIYPKHLFDLLVVADNCTDRTEEIARNLDAMVLVRSDSQNKGKWDALRMAFDHIGQSSEPYDAVVVIDADSMISGNFLQVLNHYMEEGSKVIQCSNLVVSNPNVWSSEITRISIFLFNFTRPLGRKVLGLDIGLRGNGMCFSAEVLTQCPLEPWSSTEDLANGLLLQLAGNKIDFAPEACVLSHMPEESRNAESHRARWEMGRYSVIRRFTFPLLTSFIKKGSFRYLDNLICLWTPSVVSLHLFVLVMLMLSLTGWYFGMLNALWIMVWMGLLLLGYFELLAGLYIAGADRQTFKAVRYIPVYAIWKLIVYLKSYKTMVFHS